jgi:hypothetical protein
MWAPRKKYLRWLCHLFGDKAFFFCEWVLFEIADGLVNRTGRGGENYGESSANEGDKAWVVCMYVKRKTRLQYYTYIHTIMPVSYWGRQTSVPSTCYDPYTHLSLVSGSFVLAFSLTALPSKLVSKIPFVNVLTSILSTWWPRGEYARWAIAEAKQLWSVIGWVTKNLLSRVPPCFGKHVKPLVPAAFAVVSIHHTVLGSRGG